MARIRAMKKNSLMYDSWGYVSAGSGSFVSVPRGSSQFQEPIQTNQRSNRKEYKVEYACCQINFHGFNVCFEFRETNG